MFQKQPGGQCAGACEKAEERKRTDRSGGTGEDGKIMALGSLSRPRPLL